MKGPFKVDDLADTDFFTFNSETTVPEAVTTLTEKGIFGAIVADKKRKVLGIFSEKACLRLYSDVFAGKLTIEELQQKKVTDVMYTEYQTIERDMGLIEAAQIFLKVAYRRLPVVESGRLVGQITRRDIVKGFDKFIE
ncbi:MAG: CBS domain-containing protein [SAR324 cluster bacterium]|nr:CBS domain-containing protein [SAR324 cluster bacterium]